MMNNQDFEQQFNEKIEKIRRMLESLPRVLSRSDSQVPEPAITVDSLSEPSLISLSDNRVTPKADSGELLQAVKPSESGPDSLGTGLSTPTASNPTLTKKTKKKKRTIDPLRPTKKRSFGVDIGQGINTIKFIKENCCPTTEARTKRLMNIFLRTVPTLKSQKSMDNFYRQMPLSQESSRATLPNQERSDAAQPVHREQSVLFTESERFKFRIRYRDYVNDIPNDYGIDDLQALFVPYQLSD